MADIRDILNTIKYALYGKDVRQAIHDGILKCYEDGKAGVDDIIARQEIEDMKNPSISGSLAQQIDTLNKKNVYWDGVDSNKSFLQMVLEYYQTYGATTLVEGFYRGGQASAQTLYPNPTDWMSFKFYIVTDQVKAIFQDLDQKTYSISGTIVPEWTNNNVYGRGWNELGSSESHIYLTNIDLITYIKDKIANGVTSGSFYGLPPIIGLPDSSGYYLVTWFNNHVDYIQIIAEKFIANETVGTVYYGRYWNGLLQWSELAKNEAGKVIAYKSDFKVGESIQCSEPAKFIMLRINARGHSETQYVTSNDVWGANWINTNIQGTYSLIYRFDLQGNPTQNLKIFFTQYVAGSAITDLETQYPITITAIKIC